MITLATDFDGTIFFWDESPSFRNEDLEAIHNFQSQHKLGLCSGRPVGSVTQFTDSYFKFDFMIASTGSYIVTGKGDVIVDKPIEKELAKKLVNHFMGTHDIFFHINQKFATFRMKPIDENFPQRVIQELEELDDCKTYQISIVGKSEEDAKNICDEINSTFQLNAFQNKNWVDIVHHDCSKGKGIQAVKEYLKLDQIVGIGDSHNDIPMFEECDESFTFTYSPKDIQEKTTYVVNHFHEAIQQLMNK